MKNKLLVATLISLIVLTSCNKDSSMTSLETTIAEQKISNVDSEGSFPVDVSLKEKNGKDFVIEKGGELRLKHINVVSSRSKASTANSEQSSQKPVFQVKVEEKGSYIDIPDDGLLITRKSSDNSYKFDVKLKSGTLNSGESIDFSFSVKKSATSEVVEFKKQVTTQSNISAKPKIATETNQVKDDKAKEIDKSEVVSPSASSGKSNVKKTVSTSTEVQSALEKPDTGKKSTEAENLSTRTETIVALSKGTGLQSSSGNS